MRILLSAALVSSLLISACNNHATPDLEKVKKEVTQAEKDFEKMAAEQGIAAAFHFYADESAVIRRGNDSIISGKDGIKNFYSGDYFKTASVKWSPDFVDVSENGDMAYTYGKYIWQAPDSTGKMNIATGVFHTVWKRQKDGAWKYVWD